MDLEVVKVGSAARSGPDVLSNIAIFKLRRNRFFLGLFKGLSTFIKVTQISATLANVRHAI